MGRLVPLVFAFVLAGCAGDTSSPGASTSGEAPSAETPAPDAAPMPGDALFGAPAATDAPLSATGAAAAAGSAPAGSGLKPVPAALPAVVARVNGDEIRGSDVEKAIRTLERSAGGPVPASERDRIYRGVINDLINYRLLLQESRRRQIVVTDADVNATFESYKNQYPSAAAFENVLAQQQITVDQARADIKDRMSVDRLVESETASTVAVSDSDVRAFYTENPSEFQRPRQARASHILIATPRDADAPTRQAARDRAAGLLTRVRAGEDFAALAREFSQDPGSAANGGDLGLFPEGQMVKPFNDTAFALDPGAISDVVETEYGYHIIKVLERQPSQPVPLEEARPSIERYLQQLGRREQAQAFLQTLRNKGRIDLSF